MMEEKVAVIGLGYVGLPLLVGIARHTSDVVGFDISQRRVDALCSGKDWTGETDNREVAATKAVLTTDPKTLCDRTFFIVTVPTPIDQANRPDLEPVLGACKTIGEALRGRKHKDGDLIPLIVFESTVYPGLTEDLCNRKIAEASGLTPHEDFKLGYSPERINPGDKKNRLESITKIISAEDKESVDRLEKIYGMVVTAGLYRAPSIAVAEAAKVLENTQRDLNVALMNELAIICDRLGIRTRDVLDAAGTKWNFLKFSPGLVGGHCIGVDPYYLTYRAEELDYHPEVILAGRRINDSMPVFLAQKIVKLLADGGCLGTDTHVAMLGLAFKENVRDLRNSRVPEIVRELEAFGIKVFVHDPLADPEQARHEYGLNLHTMDDMKLMDAIVLAVPHQELLDMGDKLWEGLRPRGLVVDVKSVIDPATLPKGARYWSL